MYKKIFILLILLIYQPNLQSKEVEKNNFNQKYLYNYFSALVSSNNQNNNNALKHFNLSKHLLQTHENFLKNYVLALVENNQLQKATNEIKKMQDKKNTKFFESGVLLIVEAINRNNFSEAKEHLSKLDNIESDDTFELIIKETLYTYINLFLEKKIYKIKGDFGRLNLITESFQQCYLNNQKSIQYFKALLENEEKDYSRYLFFYFLNLIENGDFNTAKDISSRINTLNSSLIVFQSKQWIDNGEFSNFSKFFSCDNPNDLLSEFFFLVSNLYSSQEIYGKSNFYMFLSINLNKKFYFNNSLLAENYFQNKNYKKTSFFLDKLKKDDYAYNWFKIKRKAQIIYNQENMERSIKYIENELSYYKNPDNKILFDIANIYKNFKKYEKSIEFYNKVLNNIKVKNSVSYADVLYRRASSYERLGNYKKSDKDLIQSLKIVPDEPYVLNYLAYSWLERNVNIDEAIKMLIKAHNLKKNDPYITDSLGWAYFLIGSYEIAEEYLNLAIQIKPYDPVIMDHYADTLWMLGRKIQAKYLWNSVLKIESVKIKDKEAIKEKILRGPKKA